MAGKMMRVAGRGFDGTAKPLSVNNDGNPEVVIKGANIENDGSTSNASFRQDENGNGIMRVYMENKLSASDGDSVNLDGVLANKFLRFPSGTVFASGANRTMLAKSNENYSEMVLLDIKSPIELISFNVITWSNLSRLRIAFYDHSGQLTYLRTPTNFSYTTEACSLQAIGENGMKKYSNPLFAAKQLDEAAHEWEFTLRDERKIYLPYGVNISMGNNTENEYKYAFWIAYNKFEVIL